jgi:hypothetical protein
VIDALDDESTREAVEATGREVVFDIFNFLTMVEVSTLNGLMVAFWFLWHHLRPFCLERAAARKSSDGSVGVVADICGAHFFGTQNSRVPIGVILSDSPRYGVSARS